MGARNYFKSCVEFTMKYMRELWENLNGKIVISED